MSFKKHAFPGLPNPVYLPDWIPVEIKIIPSKVAGWTSGQKVPASNFTSTTWHDTGNSTSNASGEWSWAAGGGRARMSPPSPGSYNIIFDATKVIVSQRFDELVGHAANHRGNTTSYGFEQAGHGPSYDFNKSLEVGYWIHAGVLQSMGKTAKAAMYQHNYWSGKNCPGQIRKRGIWNKVENEVDARIVQIKAYISGKPEPKPKGHTITVRFEVPFRTSPGFWDYDWKNEKGEKVGRSNVKHDRPTLPAGTKGELIDGPREADGVTFYDIKLPDGETGWIQDEVLHALSID